MAKTLRVEWSSGRTSARFYTTYNPAFIAAIKEVVPWTMRKWNPADKCWEVGGAYVRDLIERANDFFDKVDVVDPPDDPWKRRAEEAEREAENQRARAEYYRRLAENSHNGAGREPYATLCVVESAPVSVIKAAYRALALLYHPDTSKHPNATAEMQRINAAFEEVRKLKGF
jgi:hypothetical protein